MFSDNVLKILSLKGCLYLTKFCFFFRGVNVIPFLEFIGLPDSVVDILKNSQSGNALTAYAMFKVGSSNTQQPTHSL